MKRKDRGNETGFEEQRHYTQWESELTRSTLRRKVQYAAALVSANVVMAGSEIKDWVAARPGVQQGLRTVVNGLASIAVVADPDAYRAYRAQQAEQEHIEE